MARRVHRDGVKGVSTSSRLGDQPPNPRILSSNLIKVQSSSDGSSYAHARA